MRWTLSVLMLAGTVGLSACGDDAVGAGGADGSGTDDAGATDGETQSADETADDGDGPCTRDADCDDADPCTADVCDDGVCGVDDEPVESNECRPSIEVDYPPRAATLRSGSGMVRVEGSVASQAAPIAWLTINGEDVALEEDGRFSHEVVAQMGGNTLILETADALEVTRRRVQSFLWSNEYLDPTEAPQGVVPDGLIIYLDQPSLDDGDSSLPANDVATVLGLAVGATDIGAFIDPNVPLASQAGYDIFVTGLTFGDSSVSLQAIDGGMRMVTTLLDVQGDLWLEGVISSTGGFSIESIEATANLVLGVDENHAVVVAVLEPVTQVNNVNLWTNNGFTNFLLSIIEPFIIGGVVADIEATLTEQLTALMGPAIELAFGALAPNSTLSFPSLANADEAIEVQLFSDFDSTDFHDGQAPPDPSPPQGGALLLRGGGYALDVATPYDNLGVPQWAACGTDSNPGLTTPREAPLEIVLSDDLLNQLLHGAWQGGLLDFAMPPELLGSDGGLISDLEIEVSGMLAPTASDCGPDGQLRAHLGDVRIEGSLMLGVLPVSFVAYSSLEMGLAVVPTKTGIGISIEGVEWVETELRVDQDEAIATEPLLIATLEARLLDGVIGGLAGGGLGGIDLPQLDLSGVLGLPPGTAAIVISTDEVTRQPGSTVIAGHL